MHSSAVIDDGRPRGRGQLPVGCLGLDDENVDIGGPSEVVLPHVAVLGSDTGRTSVITSPCSHAYVPVEPDV